jgi:hypothetical protein
MKTQAHVLAPSFVAALSTLFAAATPAFAEATPELEGSRVRLQAPAAAGSAAESPALPAPPPAPAPPPPPVAVAASAPSGPTRDGFTIGFSLGVGQLATDSDSIHGGGLSVRLGLALSPSLLLQAHVETIAADDSGATVYETFSGATLTGFLGPRFYLGGGLGRVTLSVNDARGHEVGSEHAGGALVLLGLEVYQSPSFAVSVESRGYFADFSGETVSAGGLSLAFQWF